MATVALFAALDALQGSLAPLQPYAQAITVFEFPDIQAQLAEQAAPNGPIPAPIDVVKCVLFSAALLSSVSTLEAPFAHAVYRDRLHSRTLAPPI